MEEDIEYLEETINYFHGYNDNVLRDSYKK